MCVVNQITALDAIVLANRVKLYSEKWRNNNIQSSKYIKQSISRVYLHINADLKLYTRVWNHSFLNGPVKKSCFHVDLWILNTYCIFNIKWIPEIE